MDCRVQPIAIGPIKYVTYDTIRCDWKKRYSATPSGVCATFPISCDDRWITEEHLRQSGRTDGRESGLRIDLSGRYINSFSVYITARASTTVECEKSIIMEWARRLPKMLPFFRCCLSTKFLFSFFRSYFFFTRQTLAKLYYQLLLSKFPTHLATGDAINLKKIINSNFSKTSSYSLLYLLFSLFLSLTLWKFPCGGEKSRAYFFVRDLNICGAWVEFRRIIRTKELPKIWYSPPAVVTAVAVGCTRDSGAFDSWILCAKRISTRIWKRWRSFGQNPPTLGIYRDRTGTRTIDRNYERPGPKVLIGSFFPCRRWI